MRLHHLALRTDDVGRLERFYTGALELAVLRRDEGRSVWLDAGGTILMLEKRASDEPAQARSMELTCFAIAPSDLEATLARLRAADVTIEARTAYSIYFRDPDGRRLGLSSYPLELTLPP